MKRRTGKKLGFIIAQHKINQAIDYSKNNNENFRQLSLYLTYCEENKVLPPLMGGKNALVSINIIGQNKVGQNFSHLKRFWSHLSD